MGERIQVGDWVAEPELNQLLQRGPEGADVVRRVEPKVMELLVFLAGRPGRTIARRELLDALWGERFVVEGVLTRCVFELRQALGDDPRDARYIQTVAKRGYRWIAPASKANGGSPAVAPEPAPRGRSVAVLPFEDLSPRAGDPDAENADAYLSLGLADATIAELALARSLVVRPTSAIRRFQKAAVDPLQAGRELEVDAVLAGTYQRLGSRLRVTARLVSIPDGRSLWAGKTDASLDDLFRVLDEVSGSIARALHVELVPPGVARPARPAGQVYELYLKGRIHLFHETLEECLAALDCFDKACTADPQWAMAWAGLADAYSRIAFTFLPEGDWYARAWAACEKALALDPDLPEARYVRGGRLRWSPNGGFDHAGALSDLVPALAARPNIEDGHVRLAVILHHVGLLDEVERELDRALSFSPDHFLARQHHGLWLVTRGRYAEALEIYAAACDQAPIPWLHYRVALCELQLGRLDEAARTIERMVRQAPREFLQYPLRGLLAALGGDAASARREAALTEANRRFVGHYHHAQYDVGCIHALLGDADQALVWLAAAAGNGFPCHPQFAADPFLSNLRGDERFARLLDGLEAECEGYARLYRELQANSARSID